MTKSVLATNENYGNPNLKKAVGEIIHRISETLPEMKQPISMYLAGGIAVNFYTGYRSTGDIDASFSRLLLLPKQKELTVAYEEKGERRTIYFDTKYNTTFAVIHPAHEEDALIVEGKEFEDKKICLKILNPVDLAVSKIARFGGKDKEDIEQLASYQLVTAKEVEVRTTEALEYYIGNTTMLDINLQEALDIINQVQVKELKNTNNQQVVKEAIEQSSGKFLQDTSIVQEALETAQSVQKMLKKIGELQSDGSLTFIGNRWQFIKSPENIIKITVIQGNREILQAQNERVITFRPTSEEREKLREFRDMVEKESQQFQLKPKF